MGRALGIDFGTKRTGVAISDPEKIIASGLTTIPTHSFNDFIANLIIDDNIDFFVVGDPINLDGGKNDNSNHIQGLIKRLKKQYPDIPVYSIDERFTSKIAKQTILSGGLGKQKRRNKGLVDKINATIILQDFLDSSS